MTICFVYAGIVRIYSVWAHAPSLRLRRTGLYVISQTLVSGDATAIPCAKR